MQPSSLRVGPTRARSSASRSISCPSRGRSWTTRVTASLGSLELLAGLDLRGRDELFFVLRFAIVGGILLQEGRKSPIRPSTDFCGKEPRDVRASRYFSANLRPALRLSKFRMVFSTSEYVPRVSPR